VPDSHANFAASTVATAPSPATTGTSLTVAAGQGALFSTPPFNAEVCPAGTAPSATNAEIVRVTGIATDTLTIVRGPQAGDPGGINRTIVVGDQIFEGPTRKTFTDIETLAVGGDLAGSLPNPTLAVPVTTAVGMTATPGVPIFCTAAVAIALPSAPAQGARVQVVAAGGAVTINRGGTDTIFSYGQAGLTTLTLNNGTNVDLRYLGTVWYVVAGAPQGYAPWLALSSTKQLTISTGIFTTGTGTIINAGTADWTLSNNTTGQSQVNFPTRSGNPVVVATIDTAGAFTGTAQCSGITTNSAYITTFNSATTPPVPINAVASFIVIG
jgi:hypothetical protein